MGAVARRLEATFPESNKGINIELQPLQEGLFGSSREILMPLIAAVAFVLLIACVNISNLLLSRGLVRRKEVGIRAALGAGRFRLPRQLLTESVLLSLTGGLVGLLFCVLGIKIFVALAPAWLPQLSSIQIDVRVLVFTFAISLLTGILFGLMPAFRASKAELNDSLKQGGRTSSVGGLHQQTRGALVVVEVAVAMVLLVGAGLMVNTVIRVLRTSPGFRPEHLITLEVRLTGTKYFDGSGWAKAGLDRITPQVDLYCRAVLERLRQLPGTESVALADWLPMSKDAEWLDAQFSVAGQPAMGTAERPNGVLTAVSADYFKTMQVPLIRGRQFTEHDDKGSQWVALVNAAMAKKYWKDQNPIGQMITLDVGALPREERPRQIVGIVGDVRQFRLSMNPYPQIYVPSAQQAEHFTPGDTESRLHKGLILRVRTDPQTLIPRIKKTVSELDRDSPVFGIRTIDRTIYESTNSERFYMQVLGIFALLALLLAVVGIYGVMSYSVAERTHEMGLRLALGAQSVQVLRMIVGQSLRLSVLGVLIGIGASLAMMPMISNLFYGMRGDDPLTFIFVSVLLILIAMVAAYLPALRATKVDPMVTLRHE